MKDEKAPLAAALDEVMLALQQWHSAITVPVATPEYVVKATIRLRAAFKRLGDF